MTCLEIYRCAGCGRERAFGNPHFADADTYARQARLNCECCGALRLHHFVENRQLSLREQARLRRKPCSAAECIQSAVPKRPPTAAPQRDGYESEIGWAR